jgi:flagellar assembly protein FliH
MSSVIKLNAKSRKLSVSLKNPLESNNYDVETKEDVFKRQLDQQYEKGFSDGQKSVKDSYEKEYTEKITEKYDSVNDIILQLDKKIIEYESVFEKVVIDLSVSIAEKIIKKEVKRENIINDVLKESIKKVIGSNKIFVKLNPNDFEIINQESQAQFNNDSYNKIKFESDERIEKGGCLVETEIGNVDARISSQLNEISKQLEANI